MRSENVGDANSDDEEDEESAAEPEGDEGQDGRSASKSGDDFVPPKQKFKRKGAKGYSWNRQNAPVEDTVSPVSVAPSKVDKLHHEKKGQDALKRRAYLDQLKVRRIIFQFHNKSTSQWNLKCINYSGYWFSVRLD